MVGQRCPLSQGSYQVPGQDYSQTPCGGRGHSGVGRRPPRHHWGSGPSGPAGKTDIEGLCLRVELGRDQGSSAFWSDFRAESLPTMGREKGPAVFPQSMFPPAKVSSI